MRQVNGPRSFKIDFLGASGPENLPMACGVLQADLLGIIRVRIRNGNSSVRVGIAGWGGPRGTSAFLCSGALPGLSIDAHQSG